MPNPSLSIFRWRIPQLAFGAVAAMALAAPAANAAPPPEREPELQSQGSALRPVSFEDLSSTAISGDGQTVAFAVSDQLDPNDVDGDVDVYVRRGGKTTLISQGTRGGGADSADATLQAISRDGTKVYFTTSESLVIADDDAQVDLYAGNGETIQMLTRGEVLGSTAQPITFEQLAGDILYFSTREPLVAEDTDVETDVYRLVPKAGTSRPELELVSTGTLAGGGPSARSAGFVLASESGDAVYFTTRERLEAVDSDDSHDLYVRRNGVTTLLSGGPFNGGIDSASITAFTRGSVARSGVGAIFVTPEQLVAADRDQEDDVYLGTASGPPRLISGGSPGNHPVFFSQGGLASRATYLAGRIVFATRESLSPADTDSHMDIYAGTPSGDLELVSTGPLAGGADSADVDVDVRVSDIGNRIMFETPERLVPSDTDSTDDLYERSLDGTPATTLLTPSEQDDAVRAEQTVGLLYVNERAFFWSPERLDARDTDDHLDIYEHTDGVTRVVSQGGAAGGADSRDVLLTSTSDDGERALFITEEPLTADDEDTKLDSYLAIPKTPVAPEPKPEPKPDPKPTPSPAPAPGSPLTPSPAPGAPAPAPPAGPIPDPAPGPDPTPAPIGGPGAGPGGSPTGDPPAATPDRTAPAIRALSLSPRRFRAGRRAPTLGGRRSGRTGTTIRLTVSERARVTLTFARVVPGRRAGRRCVTPDRARRGRRCERRLPAGAVTLSVPAGPNTIRFDGRLSARKGLRPGRHRLTVTATDTAGNRSAPRTATFTVSR